MKLRGSIVSPYAARVVMFARTRGIELKPEPARAGDLERCMGRGPYAVGRSLTLADCAVLPAMALLNLLFIPAFRLESPLEIRPKLRAWWAQMGEDPLCVLVLQDWTMAYQELMRARPGPGSESPGS